MRFGQEDILIQVYVRELLKLVLQNTEVKKVNLSSLYDKNEAQLRALESLEVTKEKYAAMLFPLVESCLPAEILRAWERYVSYSSDESGKKDLDSLMKFLSIEVSSEDRIKLARNSFDYEKSNYKKKLGNLSTTATAADLFNRKIIEEVNDDKENFVHYLPHRPVIKENSTSKIRPVFDASARTKGSPSLNDCLEKGLNFIEVIPTILNRFQKYKIGVISDIEKAFLQIGVREQDREFLRFMWYDRENRDHIKIYRHRRVVFGVTSSPFLLGATLNHHLDNAHGNFDNIAKILRKSFYVDNCVTSFETEEQLQKFIVESKILLSSAHFNLRDWQSNVLLNPENFSELESQPDNFKTMVLGLIWNLKEDCLSCNINCQKKEGKAITKRSLLSIANHIFDPIGFTAPVTLKPKLILQEIWKLKLKWDANLPKDILNQVKKWLEQLPILAGIKIPRCLNLSSNGIKRLTLHVFCDASKKAYAAYVFLRVEYEENIFVKLIQAKARVAPLKDISIPRLELLSCTIGTRLSASVKNDLNLPDVRIYYLTDSMTALAWIQRTRDWGVFVSNRVKEIRNLSDVSSWEHVPSEKNFADILSRGCSAQQLVYLRWWKGPSWLSESPVQCPRSKHVPDEEAVNLELRRSVLVNTAKRIEEFNWHSKYFSSYLKVVRMNAWIFRFFKNAKRINVCNTSEIKFSEFDHAEKTVIKLIQMEKFEGVTDEKLRPLKQFLDEFGILRARTKLSFREDTDNFKFPIILPNEHPVVHLMIVRKHEELMHAGVSIVMNHLRESFWILKARKLIRQIKQKCTRCKRFSAQKTEVVPSSLPKDRVSNSKIFQVVGVDLAVPLHLKDRRKGWVVLFTCAVFRAVHFELITSLSTAAFLQSLRRFISRRGRPTIIYSDNGTNFVRSNSALNSIDWDVVMSKANIQKIKWKFNPPSAAWWGGFWERMIQMLKQILRKISLTYISEDVNDLSPLTPAMFLQEIETSDVTDIDCLDHQEINKRITHVQTIREQLRKRFRIEYLSQLREQTQHHRKLRPLTMGHVRVARVKTETGELVRPVQRLYNLELQEPEINLPKDLTDSVIRTRRGRKVISPKRLTYA
ncbi:integrase catalytic domain-containing protein [Trichonephila clavipes]|nr:integrase catalytic domain-containing protein [Trichonephila clavipes]